MSGAVTEQPLVLGIETSCDETGVGIVHGDELLVDAIASSVDEHARFGGVVPEVASRAHLEAMVPTIERACREAGVALSDLDGIAVTAGPGLAGLGRLAGALIIHRRDRECVRRLGDFELIYGGEKRIERHTHRRGFRIPRRAIARATADGTPG